MKIISFIFKLFLFLTLSFYDVSLCFSHDVATPSVAIDDSIYDRLDLLESHGLLTGYIVGQRPLAYSEIVRLILQADENYKKRDLDPDQNLAQNTVNFIFLMIQDLKEKFPSPEIETKQLFSVKPLEQVSVQTVLLRSPARAYFGDDVHATYNPFVQYLQGRHLAEGIQSAIETSHSLNVTRYSSFYLHPRLQLQFYNAEGGEEYQVYIQELYASFSAYNTQIDVGRKPMHWGQSRYGGILFSNNTRPMDSVQLTNPSPWRIKFLGGLKYTFFLADLGPEQTFPHAWISGGKISVKPFETFEFGIARALIFGGEGATSASFFDHFKEFFGARNSGEFSGGDAPNLSNSISGFEWRLRVPPLRSLNFYGEVYFEDISFENLGTSIINDTGVILGLYAPRLDDAGKWNLRVEGKKISPVMYKHKTWLSGWTLNQNILGDPIGPDAESLQIVLQRIFVQHNAALDWQFAFEHLDSDLYADDLSRGRFVVNNGTPEYRVRNIVGLKREFTHFLSGHINFGYEYVKNFNFVQDDSRNHFFVLTQFNWNFDQWWKARKI